MTHINSSQSEPQPPQTTIELLCREARIEYTLEMRLNEEQLLRLARLAQLAEVVDHYNRLIRLTTPPRY